MLDIRIARNNGEINSPMTDEQIANLFMYTGDGVIIPNIMKDTIEDTPNNLLAMWDGLYMGLKIT
jgi:hypothetical protein